MTLLFYAALVIFLLVCAILSFVILIQESKTMGLGASFGGDAGDSLFGTSTADVLKKFTGYLIAGFMAFCLILSIWCSSLGKSKIKSLPTTIEQLAPESTKQ